MDDRTPPADAGEGGQRGDAPFDRRRAIVGGLTLLGTVVGFTVVQAAIEAGNLSEEWVLVALPAFGVVGAVGFVVFVSAVIGD
ncbi:hypothetical protein C2R22_04225 [Salinigranum rubrum]|uniref:Uncharacterized protein n=1 Tax=Salinigranum rubrum TaxID=755307 RepID=A0A2I8VGA9_9EURY|nr:hypothetical protein [Salinigranum rubrum]AUV80965.1 hypothetical protein C2R22_04225 [Salinigranum rubrum]